MGNYGELSSRITTFEVESLVCDMLSNRLKMKNLCAGNLTSQGFCVCVPHCLHFINNLLLSVMDMNS